VLDVFPILELLIALLLIVFVDELFPILEFIFDPEPFDIAFPFIDVLDIFDVPDEDIFVLLAIVLLPVVVPPDIFVLLAIELEFILLMFEFVFVELVLVALVQPPTIKAEVSSAP